MTDKPLPRPRQATVSGGLIMVGSVLIVLLSFQQVSTLGSIEAQESAEEFLSRPPGEGLGIGVDDVQTILRALSFVAAAVGTATAILGWQVLQRVRSARLALSVLAPVLLVAGLAPAGFSSALVAAAVVMLWVQPTRDWFDGKAPAARPAAPAVASYPPGPPTGAPLGGPGSMPPPQQPSSWNLAPPGAPQGAIAAGNPSEASPYGVPPPPAPWSPTGLARPGKVTAACITTIVASGIAAAGLLVGLLYTLGSRDDLVAEIQKEFDKQSYEGVSADSFASVAVGFFAVLIVWSVAAIGLAIATMRRSNAARITLVVSAILAAVVSLLGILVIAPLALTAACVATAVLLLGGDAKAWFAAPR